MRKINVSEQVYEVYLSNYVTKSWDKRVSHIVKVGEFEFSFVPQIKDWSVEITISELTSGARLSDVRVHPFEVDELDTRAKTIRYFERLAQGVDEVISKHSEEIFKICIEAARTKAIENCGAMPEIKEL